MKSLFVIFADIKIYFVADDYLVFNDPCFIFLIFFVCFKNVFIFVMIINLKIYEAHFHPCLAIL